MSTRRHAFAVLFLSAAVAAPVFVADRTLADDHNRVSSQSSLSTCGNGRLQPSKGEVCDDGNNVNGDGCSADCRSRETCGNGIVDPTVGEQCDTSGETATCNNDCTVAFCGDGKVNASRLELCDEAGPSPTCNVFCQPPVCGNGVIDGLLEQCDDGNFSDLDGCTSQCQFNCSISALAVVAEIGGATARMTGVDRGWQDVSCRAETEPVSLRARHERGRRHGILGIRATCFLDR